MLSDNLLLTSVWLVPLIGVAAVLILPKRNEQLAKWVSLGFTSVTFLITLVILGIYLGNDDTYRRAPRSAGCPCRKQQASRIQRRLHRVRKTSRETCWSGSRGSLTSTSSTILALTESASA